MSNPIVLSSHDEKAIHQLLTQMNTAWNEGNGEAYAAVFSEDARYVNAPGLRLIGRDAISKSHQEIFNTLFKNTHLGNNYPLEIQPITPDIAILHMSGAVLFSGEAEDAVEPNGLITIVAAKRNNKWQFVSFNNTQTGKFRNIKFFLRYIVSRMRRK